MQDTKGYAQVIEKETGEDGLDGILQRNCGRCGMWPALYLVSGHNEKHVGLQDDPACSMCARDARKLGLIVQGLE